MKQLIYIILLTSAIWFTSCRSIQYIPIETVRTEYKTRDSIRFDSIYQRDSVFLYKNGDTIYQYKYKYLYKYQYINKTDTVIKTDSVQIPYPVYIEKKLALWGHIKQSVGGIALLFIIGFIVGWLVYRWRKK